MLTIAADPKHLGARIGILSVLHTWGSAMTHHPHAHCLVPGGGLSPDGKCWIPCKPRFLPPRVLSRLFRRLVLEGLTAAFDAGRLHFFTGLSGLNDKAAFAAALAPLRRTDWVVYAKRTFAGPKRVLAYLARYTHRVAIANDRLLGMNGNHVSFICKDSGGTRKVMTLKADEFIRRFLLHVLPDGFHRIRNYGLLGNGHRAEKLALCRKLLEVPSTPKDRSLTRISIYLTTSEPLAHAAAGACRSLRASRQRWLAASTYANQTRHNDDRGSLALNNSASNRRRAYGNAHACRLLQFAVPFCIGINTRAFYQRGDPAKGCQLSIPCLGVVGTQRLQWR
jgi:hypothetical protein